MENIARIANIWAEQNVNIRMIIDKRKIKFNKFQNDVESKQSLYKYAKDNSNLSPTTAVSTDDFIIGNLNNFAPYLPRNTIFKYMSPILPEMPDYRFLKLNNTEQFDYAWQSRFVLKDGTTTKDFAKQANIKQRSIFKPNSQSAIATAPIIATAPPMPNNINTVPVFLANNLLQSELSGIEIESDDDKVEEEEEEEEKVEEAQNLLSDLETHPTLMQGDKSRIDEILRTERTEEVIENDPKYYFHYVFNKQPEQYDLFKTIILEDPQEQNRKYYKLTEKGQSNLRKVMRSIRRAYNYEISSAQAE